MFFSSLCPKLVKMYMEISQLKLNFPKKKHDVNGRQMCKRYRTHSQFNMIKIGLRTDNWTNTVMRKIVVKMPLVKIGRFL